MLGNLLDYIKESYSPEDPLLLLGDFNIAMDSRDVYDPEGLKGSAGFHPEEQSILSRFFEWGFVDIFRKYNQEAEQYTFWDYRIPNALKRKKGWRIDYITATRSLAEKSKSTTVDLKQEHLKNHPITLSLLRNLISNPTVKGFILSTVNRRPQTVNLYFSYIFPEGQRSRTAHLSWAGFLALHTSLP